MSSLKKWQSNVRQLKALLDSLPSREEREEVVRGISEVITILGEVGKSLGSLPTSQEAAKAKDALEDLENILARNPLLRATPPKNKKTLVARHPQRRGESSGMPIARDDVLEEIGAISQLPEDALRNRLQQRDRYSRELLRSILAELGRRAPAKATRHEMIDQIVVTIVNRRTYEGLGGNEGSNL